MGAGQPLSRVAVPGLARAGQSPSCMAVRRSTKAQRQPITSLILFSTLAHSPASKQEAPCCGVLCSVSSEGSPRVADSWSSTGVVESLCFCSLFVPIIARPAFHHSCSVILAAAAAGPREVWPSERILPPPHAQPLQPRWDPECEALDRAPRLSN